MPEKKESLRGTGYTIVVETCLASDHCVHHANKIHATMIFIYSETFNSVHEVEKYDCYCNDKLYNNKLTKVLLIRGLQRSRKV